MRLTGDVQVYNRLLPTYNIPNKRSEWSYLSIGYYNNQKGEIFMLHQTQKNGLGVRYKILGNLLGVHTKWITQGKMTLRFKKPSHDLIIHTTEDQLRKFCSILQALVKGENNIKSWKLFNLSDVPRKIEPKPKTKLCLNNKKDIHSISSFPRSLETLQLNNADLTHLDCRILRLQKLTVLNLENNCLETLPDQLSLLPSLKELHLAKNLLGQTALDTWLLAENLQLGLSYLDLRQNRIRSLPSNFYKLKTLKTLLLDDNLISKLPNSFGRLVKLKELSLSFNMLTVLPASFRFLILDIIDTSCNPRLVNNFDHVKSVYDTHPDISLVDIAAKNVLNKRLEYDEKSLPRELITYLDQACYCVCRQATFPSTPEGFSVFDITRFGLHVTFTESRFPIEVRFCSNRCRANNVIY